MLELFNMFEVGISENTYEFDDLFKSSDLENCFNMYEFDNPEAFFSNILDDNVVTFNTFKSDNSKTSFEQANNERDGEVIEYKENLSNLSSNEFINYDKKESELKYPIELEMSFNNCEKDKEDGIPRHRTYKCMKGQPYISQKEAHTINDRDSGHNTTGCTFHINAYRCKKDNLIYISKIDSYYNHALVDNINMVAAHYRKFSPEMHEEIKFLATCE
ncbi:23222_t:CDS:2, partial [Gigaspora margarita]